MENKGLNIFNSAYVLADARTATDNGYANVEGVVGHEYFHNWSGDRVTARDWFNLSLKEGLTVYRDQEFSRDQRSRAVNRIGDVAVLLFHAYPKEAEGDLAKRHSELVKAETLAVVAEELKLGDYFIFPKSEKNSVDKHSKTLLSDVCEAVIAALYLDGGFETAKEFVERFWTPLMKESKKRNHIRATSGCPQY